MSTIIIGLKEALYRHTPLRILCEVLALAALLLFWLLSDSTEVSFVYNAF